MPGRRTVGIVTGSRAEFGLLRPVLDACLAHRRLDVKLTVCGSHLVSGTAKDIARQGYTVDARVRMQRAGQTGRSADAEALGRGVTGFAKVLHAWQPDFVVVLGDRVEAFAAASAASVAGFRVAHLHGGDRAEGVADEAMRHAITKLAHLHLPATAQSRQRILRMGEAAEAVVRVGSPAIDGLNRVEPATDAPRCLVMHHPEGGSDDAEAKATRAVLSATRGLKPMVFAPNLDPGRDGVMDAIEAAGLKPVSHLTRDRFLSLLKGAELIVGNSSAGLIEAAALKTACVNVGSRQAGRERPAHLIDAEPTVKSIREAIDRALKLDLRRLRHPYGRGDTGPRVATLLATIDLSRLPRRKQNTY